MRIGGREFDTKHHCYIMGILNITPDSFSDGGKFERVDRALFRVEEMVEEGADIIDIGGESTRPGCTEIGADEEMARVIPVIENIKTRFNIPISLDTYKPKVAREGIAAGADLINDIRGLQYDMAMASVIAAANVPCCLMHNRREANYNLLVTDVIDDLQESLILAQKAGIAAENIILDPGIGFGKTYEQNLEIIGSLERLHVLGHPLLLGCSRKSVIGLALDLPVEERMEGTLVTTVFAVLKGCSFVRVHDVRENVRAVRMAEILCEAATATCTDQAKEDTIAPPASCSAALQA